MTKTDLQNYRADKRRLDRISAQLAELETRVCVQSAADPPFSKHCVTLSGLPPSDEGNGSPPRESRLRTPHSRRPRVHIRHTRPADP